MEIISKINKLTTFKKLVNYLYPLVVSNIDNILIPPENDITTIVGPEHPLFIQVLKRSGYSKEQIESILVDYYSGDSLENILKSTGYVVVAAMLTLIVVYGDYYLYMYNVLDTLNTEKQLFDWYKEILNFLIDNNSDEE